MITNLLRDRFLSGYYAHNTKLPDERTLAEELAVSRKTIRAALDVLEKESLISRHSRLGTFLNIGNISQDKVCYYILPAHNIFESGNICYSGMIGHFRMISHLKKMCHERDLQYTLIPLSNDNISEHIIAERLLNLPRNAKLILPGAGWYQPLAPLIMKKGFRVAMIHTYLKGIPEDHPDFCHIAYNGHEFFRKGVEFLKKLGCKRIMYVTGKADPTLSASGCTIIQEDYPLKCSLLKMRDPKQIGQIFIRHKCDALFCSNFTDIQEYRSINFLFKIPEHVPVLLNDNIMDVSLMTNPPHLIGFDTEELIRLGLDFLFSGKPGGKILADKIVIYKTIKRE